MPAQLNWVICMTIDLRTFSSPPLKEILYLSVHHSYTHILKSVSSHQPIATTNTFSVSIDFHPQIFHILRIVPYISLVTDIFSFL